MDRTAVLTAKMAEDAFVKLIWSDGKRIETVEQCFRFNEAMRAIINGQHVVIPAEELQALRAALSAAERVLRIYADATAPITGEFARGYFGED